jgi:hypothetical protein
METSQMNLSLHSDIIQGIREISVDRRSYFVNTLEQIISDLQDQITIDDVRDPSASASRISRRPETPVLDSWGLWTTLAFHSNHNGCWWVNCSQVTINLIEKIFVNVSIAWPGEARDLERRYGVQVAHGERKGFGTCTAEGFGDETWAVGTSSTRLRGSRHDNITWGTLLRYFTFIHLEIYAFENVEGVDVVAEMEEETTGPLIVDKFNNEEEGSMTTLTSERAMRLGYLMPITSRDGSEQTPEQEQTPGQTTAQRNNQSARKLQDIIDSLSRGEKYDINEGEHLQLSDYLKRSFV